jgi:hypothetical protein
VKIKQSSALAGRIAAGKADPISEEERAIVAELRANYEKKFGRDSNKRSTSKRLAKTT